MKRPSLTQSDLDAIRKELLKSAAPIRRNKKGEPCYYLHFHGTKKEHAVLKRKLGI